MIRIIITSDSHGCADKLFTIVQKHIKDANKFINLGDCRSGDDLLFCEKKLNMKFMRVAGNCDFFYEAPDIDFLETAGKKILLCHGHTFSVKAGYEKIMKFAAETGCDAALFGHTHMQWHEYINGIHFLCPGAVKNGQYAMLDIENGKIICIKATL
ncbi:MAG: YfcE family phosphodiesterase [Clostridiales bacterium]|nr:YfcE family phosphodiesterase [Clostridiales bacterium]